MRITHSIYFCCVDRTLDLKNMYLEKAELKSRPFYCIHWRQYGGLCQLFPSGKVILHCSYDVAGQYMDTLKPYGTASAIQLRTQSAVHDLSGRINYYKLCETVPCVTYEPELFHACMLRKASIHFIVYHTGKVIMTGIKSQDDIDEYVWPTLLELEQCTC